MADDQGIRCPHCGCGWHEVYYGRARRGRYQRVRICKSPRCGRKFVTGETVLGDAIGQEKLHRWNNRRKSDPEDVAN